MQGSWECSKSILWKPLFHNSCLGFFAQWPAACQAPARNLHFTVYGKKNASTKVSDSVCLCFLYCHSIMHLMLDRHETFRLLLELCVKILCDTELPKCTAVLEDSFQSRDYNRCSNCCKSLLRTSCLCFYKTCLTYLELFVMITK